MQKLIKLNTKTGPDFIDITKQVNEIVKESGIEQGICNVFCKGSTGSILINENDSALIRDLKNMIEKLIPENLNYDHPSNSFSHLRASLFGSSQSIPVINRELYLGTWQSIFFINFDNSPRTRQAIVSVFGK